MKRTLLILVFIAVALSAQSRRQKAAPKKPETACHIGSAHNCHCPRMVTRSNDKAIDYCLKTTTSEAAYIKCLTAERREECTVIQYPDPEHRADACKAACKMDVCRCHDGPPCGVHGFDYDKVQQQGVPGPQ